VQDYTLKTLPLPPRVPFFFPPSPPWDYVPSLCPGPSLLFLFHLLFFTSWLSSIPGEVSFARAQSFPPPTLFLSRSCDFALLLLRAATPLDNRLWNTTPHFPNALRGLSPSSFFPHFVAFHFSFFVFNWFQLYGSVPAGSAGYLGSMCENGYTLTFFSFLRLAVFFTPPQFEL